MTAQLFQAELDGGRVLTYVAGAEDEVDAIPRVYVGNRTTYEDDPTSSVPMPRRFSTTPALSVGEDIVLTPAGARELAERLLVAAAQAEARCACGHEFWQHHNGDLCSGHHLIEGRRQLCTCGRFRFEITRSQVGA